MSTGFGDRLPDELQSIDHRELFVEIATNFVQQRERGAHRLGNRDADRQGMEPRYEREDSGRPDRAM